MSKDIKWTPGPWFVNHSDDGCPWGVVQVSDNRQIRPEGRSFSEAKANAHLVAASPELYEALSAITEMYTDMINSGDCGNWNPEYDEEVTEARRVMAKARGEHHD